MTARSAIPCTTAPAVASNVLQESSLTGPSTRYSMAFSEKAPLSPWNATMGRTRQHRQCAPPSTSAASDSACFARGLRSQLTLGKRSLLADVGRRAGDDALGDFEQHHGAWFVDDEVLDGLRLDENEREPRIVRATVSIAALIAEPRLPIRLVQLLDQVAVLRHGRDAGDRDPLARLH